MTRLARKAPAKKVGAYFLEEKTNIQFIRSGCTLFDLALGGGWPLGRIVNVIGNSSTGKTLLAIEACAQFARHYDGPIWYREAEAAFDTGYAEQLGLPVERVKFWDDEAEKKPFNTVEDFFEDLQDCIKQAKGKAGLYVLDSLDALSDREEQKREIDKGTFGAQKAKQMSQLFRRLVRALAASDICVFIISQVRDKIGGMGFGDMTSRSGGRALDFYATQIVRLAMLEQLKKTISGMTETVGIHIRAKVTKNKIGLPHREANFDILFGWGIDNMTASLEWLAKAKKLGITGMSEADAKRLILKWQKMDPNEFQTLETKIDVVLSTQWRALQQEFMPLRRKYEDAA
jgi:recombination protein RecA